MAKKTQVYSLLFCLNVLFSSVAFSQFKVVVVGSSTAAGAGASSIANSWAGKFKSYIQSINPANSLVNLAVGGSRTDQCLPTNLGGDSTKNITKALSYHPSLVIVSLVSNDASANMAISTTMANFRIIKQKCDSAGVPFWITTTQPRDFPDQWQRNLLIATKDSIYNQFNNVIDFWTSLANADGTVNSLYGIGDGVHVNDAAHDILYNRVKAKYQSAFGLLPVQLISFKASRVLNGAQLEWAVSPGNSNQFVIEKSADGIAFQSLTELFTQEHTLKYLDNQFTGSRTYYRIKVNNNKYSNVIQLEDKADNKPGFLIYPNPVVGTSFNLISRQNSAGVSSVVVHSSTGQEVYRKSFSQPAGTLSQTIQHPDFRKLKGLYLITVITGSERNSKFISIQ